MCCWCGLFAHTQINWHKRGLATHPPTHKGDSNKLSKYLKKKKNVPTNKNETPKHFFSTAYLVLPFLSFLSDVQVGQPTREKGFSRLIYLPVNWCYGCGSKDEVYYYLKFSMYFVLSTLSLGIVSIAIVDGVQLISISPAIQGCIRCVGDVFWYFRLDVSCIISQFKIISSFNIF